MLSSFLKSPTLSKELFSMIIFLLCPAFCSRDLTMYLVSSAFITSSRFSMNYFKMFVSILHFYSC